MTVEQSRNTLRDLVLVKKQHVHEVDDLNTQISIRDKQFSDMHTKACGKVKKSKFLITIAKQVSSVETNDSVMCIRCSARPASHEFCTIFLIDGVHHGCKCAFFSCNSLSPAFYA